MPAAFHPPVVSSTFSPPVGLDVCCSSCGYNLRSLQYAAVCPECGRPVSASLRRGKLALANPAWLAQLRMGATIILISVPAAAFVQIALFFLWPVLPAGWFSRDSSVPDLFTLVFGFSFALAWLIAARLLTAARKPAAGQLRRKIRRGNLQKLIITLCLVPFLSTVATAVEVGDIPAEIYSFPELDAAISVLAVAGSVAIAAAAILLLVHLRTIVRREICKGLHILLAVLTVIGSVVGAAWIFLLCLSDVVATIFMYPPLAILMGIAAYAAKQSGGGGIAQGPTPSMLIEFIIGAALVLLIFCLLLTTLFAFAWFRSLIGDAIQLNAGRTNLPPTKPDGNRAIG